RCSSRCSPERDTHRRGPRKNPIPDPAVRLDVSFTQKWNQFTNEVAIRRGRRIAVRDVELIQRRLDHLLQGSAGEVDAGVTLEQPKDPLHLPLRALLACNGKDAPELLPLVGGALAQGVDEHERAL